MDISFYGVLIGAATFLIIGLFHPLVIKGEYYFGEKIKWAFLAGGILFLVLSLIVSNLMLSILCGVTSFSAFWGIKEVKEQTQRVRKGWFPANPKHPERYASPKTSAKAPNTKDVKIM